MEKIIKKRFIILGMIFVFFFILIQPVAAMNLEDAFKGPLNQVADGAGYKTSVNAQDAASTLIGQIIQVVLSFIGVIFLVLMIYGGYMWMLARGNEQQVTKAKELITAAIIGLIIVLASFAISYFILQKFGQATLKDEGPERLGDPSYW